MRMVNNKESVEEKVVSKEAGEGADSGTLDSLEVGSEKVSEIVGESAKENVADRGKKKKVVKSSEDKALTHMSPAAQKTVLPSVAVQKKKIKQVLKKEHQNLMRDAIKMQRGKHFSAHKLENIFARMRKIQFLMAELVVAAKDRIQSMYEQYVAGAKN